MQQWHHAMSPDDVPRPVERQHRWPDPDEGPWLLTMSYTLSDAGVECHRMTIEPVDSSSAQSLSVSRRVLAEIPLSRFARKYAEETAERFGPGDLLGWTAARAAKTKHDLTLAHYDQVAAIYRAAAAAGEHPTKAVAEAFGISRSLAATWVKRARGHNRLEDAPRQGKAGGGGSQA